MLGYILIYFMGTSSYGDWGSHLDATFSITIALSNDVHISVHAPDISPRVLNFVVFGSIHDSITDSQNSVVNVVSTLVIEHTAPVELEE